MTMSEWISGGSLLIALFALWRTFAAPTIALRTTLVRELAQLRVELAALSTQIPFGLQSRQRVSSALGTGGGNLEIFKRETEADLAEVRTIEGRVGDMEGVVRWITSYADMEEKAKEVTSARTRAKQLADKYAAAFAKDEADRAFIRESVTQRAARQMERGS
jgi:hypothetical protein